MKILKLLVILSFAFSLNIFAAGDYDSGNDKGADTVYSDALNLIKKEKYNFAIPELKSLIHKQSTYYSKADIYNYLGFSYRKLKKYKKAEKYYLKSLKLENDHIGALEYIGELYIETNKINMAEKYLEKLRLAAGQNSVEYLNLYELVNSFSPN